MATTDIKPMQLEVIGDPGAPPIDSDHLARYTLGETQLEREVLQLFCDQIMSVVPRLNGAISTRDWKMAMHTLKGSGRAVGAWRLAAAAAAAERLDTVDLAVRHEAIRQVEDAAREVVEHVRQRSR